MLYDTLDCYMQMHVKEDGGKTFYCGDFDRMGGIIEGYSPSEFYQHLIKRINESVFEKAVINPIFEITKEAKEIRPIQAGYIRNELEDIVQQVVLGIVGLHNRIAQIKDL